MATRTTTPTEHLDVLIVGAGISGIGIAWHLQDQHPGRDYAILEMREDLGGTWDLFRYPGIRSDSDLQTFGYEFQPWTGEDAIADGAEIKDYLRRTADQHGISDRIRFGHRVVAVDFRRSEARWHVTVEQVATGEQEVVTCSWLFAATGYYDYDAGYRPDFPGEEDFDGRIVHPQQWPDDLDHTDLRVVVIGSGATAVTLVPAMATDAAHVTMLQRSPTYVLPLPRQDAIANLFQRVLGPERGHALARRKNILQQQLQYRLARRFPGAARRLLRSLNKALLPDGYDVDTHFNPDYDPWDERLCVVPDGDLFTAISAGDAEVVTDHIDTFTAGGIRLRSGRELPADLVVTATGLSLELFGGVVVTIDGQEVDATERVTFRGMMLSGMPNFAFTFGYVNASWTLKVDLVGEHLGRILEHMDRVGADTCEPVLPPTESSLEPFLDFDAGYVQRSLHLLPKRGQGTEWRVDMDYLADRDVLRGGPVVSDDLTFTNVAATTSAVDAPALVS